LCNSVVIRLICLEELITDGYLDGLATGRTWFKELLNTPSINLK